MAALTSTERSRLRRARLATTTTAPDLLFVREDWQLYLDAARLPQKAGCPARDLRRLALKEFTDNGLDTGTEVTVDQLDVDTWEITDEGPGLECREIARLFALNRPLTSSKLLRRPTRGAVGNGLRVAVGAVVASGGRLWVESKGHRYEVRIDRKTGTAEAVVTEPSQCNGPGRVGSKLRIWFGPHLPRSDDDGDLARDGLRFPGRACAPFRSHPGWYDDASWSELVAATPPGITIAELLAHFGIASDNRGSVTDLRFAHLESYDLPEEPKLLPRGAGGLAGYCYASESSRHALIECWAKATERCPPSKGQGKMRLYINRTRPPLRCRVENEGWLWIGDEILCKVAFTGGARYDLELSVTAPFVPITNDSKVPDLGLWRSCIGPLVERAMRHAHRELAPIGKKGDIKEAAYAVMEEAYLKASGNGKYPSNARQIMYVCRQMVAVILGPDREPLKADYFTQGLLPDFISEHEELCANWDVIYDSRGNLIVPHTRQQIPLGTAQVRDYLSLRSSHRASLLSVGGIAYSAEPRHRYRTCLFVEKEGFLPQIVAARIPERFDCAIASSKGQPTVAVRALLDQLGRHGTVILIAHDFDAAGLAIANTLMTSNRRYKFKHPPEMIDIGLRLDHVEQMGLQDEPEAKKRPSPAKLASYGATRDEIDFLCQRERRVELNSMTAPQFIAWLESNLVMHGRGKVVPDTKRLEITARDVLAAGLIRVRTRGIEEQARAEAEVAQLPPILAQQVEWQLRDRAELSWEDAVDWIMRKHSPELSGLDDEPDSDNDQH